MIYIFEYYCVEIVSPKCKTGANFRLLIFKKKRLLLNIKQPFRTSARRVKPFGLLGRIEAVSDLMPTS